MVIHVRAAIDREDQDSFKGNPWADSLIRVCLQKTATKFWSPFFICTVIEVALEIGAASTTASSHHATHLLGSDTEKAK